jgi:hypothetical protein
MTHTTVIAARLELSDLAGEIHLFLSELRKSHSNMEIAAAAGDALGVCLALTEAEERLGEQFLEALWKGVARTQQPTVEAITEAIIAAKGGRN